VGALAEVVEVTLSDGHAAEAAEALSARLVVDLGGGGRRAAAPGATVLVVRDEDDLGPELLGARALGRGRSSVIVRLIAIAPDGSRGVVEEGVLPLLSWKWRKTRLSLLEAVAAWPARALAEGGALELGRAIAAPIPALAARPPTAWQIRASELRALADRLASRLVEDQWAIGVVDRPVSELVHGLPHDRVRWLDPPPGGFLADPMALPGNDAADPVVLAEVYWFRERRGKIVAVNAGRRQGQLAAPVLDRPWHLSYPFLIRHEGGIYCLPEMHEARRAQLFRADPFPDRWVEGPVLLEDFAAVDATLHHDGERFWLFCANQDDLPVAKLYLFHSDRLETGWRPHPHNPVRCDLRNSRPAGPLFARDGTWWRPAQDCSVTYGGAIVLNRILELTPTRFREEAAARLAPDPKGPYPDGLHTLCPAGHVTLIDGKRRFVALGRAPAVVRELWSRAVRRGPPA
jgi:hypothetical protein